MDAIAHQAILDAPQGQTIGVLGCGVECCSPSNNQAIYDKIIRNFEAVLFKSGADDILKILQIVIPNIAVSTAKK